MPSLEPDASTLFVGHVAAMSDTALGEFIQLHREPDGTIVLPVDGWDVLSKDERARLAERLQYCVLPARETSCSVFTNDSSGPSSEPLPRALRHTPSPSTLTSLMHAYETYLRTNYRKLSDDSYLTESQDPQPLFSTVKL
jgi:hypothetical protein